MGGRKNRGLGEENSFRSRGRDADNTATYGTAKRDIARRGEYGGTKSGKPGTLPGEKRLKEGGPQWEGHNRERCTAVRRQPPGRTIRHEDRQMGT